MGLKDLFNYSKNKEKAQQKQRERELKILAKEQAKFEDNKEKYMNPKLNVNKLPGEVIVEDNFLFIRSRGSEYNILYDDIKSLELKGVTLIIKTNVDEFKVIPQLGYNLSMPYLFDQIQENRTKAKNPIISESSDANELEKIAKMYQDGLLTDEEFADMKKKIINNE